MNQNIIDTILSNAISFMESISPETALLKNSPSVFENLSTQIEITSFIILIIIFLEIILDYCFYKTKRDFRESWIDIGITILFELGGKFGGVALSFTILSFASQFALMQIANTHLNIFLAVLLYDFMFYWTHRLEHSSRLFWTWHNVHHSSSEYNLTTALRLSWIEPFMTWYTLLPIVLLGFQPITVILAVEISLLCQTFLHTKKIKRLGFLELIFNTPSSHRVHHGSNKKYIDKNYGAMLIIWDRLFGTYQKEEEPVHYGLSKAIKSKNPLFISIAEPLKTLRGFFRIKGIKQKITWLFGAP